MTQLDLAKAIGYEQGYLSSIELGLKTPSQEFLNRLVEKVQLGEEDRLGLEVALSASNRHFSLPHDASTETYRFCNALWAKIDQMHPALMQALHSMIAVEDQVEQRPRHQPTRLRRRRKKETPM